MMRTGCLRHGSKPRPLLQSPLQPYRASAEHVTYSAEIEFSLLTWCACGDAWRFILATPSPRYR